VDEGERRTSRLLSPLTVPPAHQHVVDRLRRSIALGEFLPGERLPAERTLAESLGVSRVTVREALKTLQEAGLVEARRGANGGHIVLDPSDAPEERRRRLRDMAPLMRTVYEFRQAIEPVAAGLAAQRRSDAQLAAITGANEALATSGDAAGFRQADSAFHLEIAAASCNQMLHDAIEDARTTLFADYDAQGFEVLREPSYRGHLDIIAAIEKGDDIAATRAMRDHIDQAWAEIFDEISRA
jgi:DNA-binding FadR family transcriptional regulator